MCLADLLALALMPTSRVLSVETSLPAISFVLASSPTSRGATASSDSSGLRSPSTFAVICVVESSSGVSSSSALLRDCLLLGLEGGGTYSAICFKVMLFHLSGKKLTE